MADIRVIDYIKKARSVGQKDENIKTTLLQNGWSEEEVNENLLAVGLEAAQAKPAYTQPAEKAKPTSSMYSNMDSNLIGASHRPWLLISIISLVVIVV